MSGLANVVYLPLFSKDAVKLTTGGATYNWKWTVPTTLQERRAPVCYLSIQSCYCDDSTGASAGIPHLLRLKTMSENMLFNENTAPFVGYPIVAQMNRDTPAGHWTSFYENNPRIQVPSNLNILEFDLIDGGGNIISIDSTAGETLNIIVKLEYPDHNEVRDITLKNYAQSIVGNPPLNRL
jgi:hypothetical protein